jgi:bacillithiol synthase
VNTIEPACLSVPKDVGLRIERLAFDRIPHQSRLFLDYQRDPLALRRFYPSAVHFHHNLVDRSSEVLSNYEVSRETLCDALESMNQGWGAKEETLKNISLLRSRDTLAVVTGQQVGVLTGPLYTIYKAFSAIKLARCLNERGTTVVPVFWMATEDHDWDEVAFTEFFNQHCQLSKIEVSGSMHIAGTPVGTAIIDRSIEKTTEQLLNGLPDTEFIQDIATIIRDAYMEGRSFGDAFAHMMTSLMSNYGLILLDPLDKRLKKLASPIYIRAIERAQEIASATNLRSRKLEEAGYHAQVFTSTDAFPLFIHLNGERHALVHINNSSYRVKGAKPEYTSEELIEKAQTEPEQFSPNVMLRAVVQDYLLPTVVYIGGAAEIAYFAQTAEVYRVLDRPVTPILHRASLTIVEPGVNRTLKRFDLHLTDFFSGFDHVVARVVEKYLGLETARAFEKTDEIINNALNNLQKELHHFDPTLADALNRGKRKINYQLDGLRTRFYRSQMERDHVVHRQLERAYTALYPEKSLQERHINISSLLARHGRYMLDWIYDAIDLNSNEHHILFLE